MHNLPSTPQPCPHAEPTQPSLLLLPHHSLMLDQDFSHFYTGAGDSSFVNKSGLNVTTKYQSARLTLRRSFSGLEPQQALFSEIRASHYCEKIQNQLALMLCQKNFFAKGGLASIAKFNTQIFDKFLTLFALIRYRPSSHTKRNLSTLLNQLSGLCYSYQATFAPQDDHIPFHSFVKQITHLLAQSLGYISSSFPQHSRMLRRLLDRFCQSTAQLTLSPVPSKLRRYQLSDKKEKRASSAIPELQHNQESKEDSGIIYQTSLNRFSSTILGDGSKQPKAPVVLDSEESSEVRGPTFVCRMCEENIPVINEESHTNYCEKRRDILDTKRKEVGNALFKAYTDLRKLLSSKRDQRTAERSKSFSLNVVDQTIVSARCNQSHMHRLKQSASQVTDNKTCESEEDETFSFQHQVKSTLHNTSQDKFNSSFDILIEHLGASVKSNDLDEPTPFLVSNPSCDSDASIASQPREEYLGSIYRKKKESQKSQFLKQKLSSQKLNEGSSSEETDIVGRVKPFLQSFRVGKSIKKLRLQRGRQLSPLIKSAREGDNVKSTISKMRKDLMKRTMSQTMVTQNKASNSFRALAQLSKLAKTCYESNITKETSVGVLEKAHSRIIRYLERYGFSREERNLVIQLRDIVKEKYDLAVMLCQLDRQLESTKYEDSFCPLDEYFRSRRNSRAGRFLLTHQRSKSENSSKKKSKKGRQKVSKSPIRKEEQCGGSGTTTGVKSGFLKEQEAIESVYQEDESFSPHKEGDTSFNFDTIFQINKIPPKDLTVVPEEAKMLSSTCANDQIQFLRIQSVQEGQLAALNFGGDPQHRRLSSLTQLERKSSDSPDKRITRATTACLREPVIHLDDGELTPSFNNMNRLTKVDVIDQLLEELDPCEKKEEEQPTNLFVKVEHSSRRRSSGSSRGRSMSGHAYIRLRRSVAPDSLSEPGMSRDFSETRHTENWGEVGVVRSHSSGMCRFESDSDEENGSFFKREHQEWNGSCFELNQMRDQFSEIGPIARNPLAEAPFCSTDLIRDLVGERGRSRFQQPEESETQGDTSSLQESLNLSKCQSMEFTPSMLESVRSLEPSKVSINNFRIIKKLSQGAYGDVVLAEQKKSKDFFAVKIMNVKEVVQKNQFDLLSTEKEILNSVNSDFVVHGAYFFKDENYFYIAMEYMPGGDLASLLEREVRIEWEEARFYLMEIVQALEYMRSVGYIHRDLKPDNILLDKQGHVKLADFGLSKAGLLQKKQKLRHSLPEERKLGSLNSQENSANYGSRKRSATLTSTATLKKSQDQRILGTPNYMAPEVVDGKSEHSYAVDYWSLGVIAYELIVGAFPFLGENVKELFSHILEGEVEYPEICEDMWTKETDDLIKRLLDRNPETRLGAKDISEIKEHPFFRGIDWTSLRNTHPPYSPEISAISKQNAELSWSTYLKVVKKRSGNKKKSTMNSNLEPVMEEGSQCHFKDWDSQNFKYLKSLNHKEALKKLASFKRRI